VRPRPGNARLRPSPRNSCETETSVYEIKTSLDQWIWKWKKCFYIFEKYNWHKRNIYNESYVGTSPGQVVILLTRMIVNEMHYESVITLNLLVN